MQKAIVKSTGQIVNIVGTIDSCTYLTDTCDTYYESQLDFDPDLVTLANIPITMRVVVETVEEAVRQGYIPNSCCATEVFKILLSKLK